MLIKDTNVWAREQYAKMEPGAFDPDARITICPRQFADDKQSIIKNNLHQCQGCNQWFDDISDLDHDDLCEDCRKEL